MKTGDRIESPEGGSILTKKRGRQQMSIFLGFGSNLGDRLGFLSSAIGELKELGVFLSQCSSLYETAPVGIQSQHDFLNMVASVETERGPWSLLEVCLQVEAKLGRSREKEDRTIDIDLLFFGKVCISSPGLEVPHPRVSERRFVLMPLEEIAPSFIDPRSGKTLARLLEDCHDRSRVSLVQESPFA